jgi:hypothetical protein
MFSSAFCRRFCSRATAEPKPAALSPVGATEIPGRFAEDRGGDRNVPQTDNMKIYPNSRIPVLEIGTPAAEDGLPM